MVRARKKKRSFLLMVLLLLVALVGVGGAISVPLLSSHTDHLRQLITEKFEQNRWAIPARVYARPLELAPGKHFSPALLEDELQLAGYLSRDTDPLVEGSYRKQGRGFEVKTRSFRFPEGDQESIACRIVYASGDRIASILDLAHNQELDYLRFDPITIASFLPENFEDRILVSRKDMPDAFIQLLLAVEDREFYEHRGVDPKGIFRAFLQNLRARRTVAGGSTLTQQLVKNHFLTNDRTLKRKLNEVIMANLLEKQYSKEEILVAYCNEVFMGQDGKRAIHGFALASQYYFTKSLGQLDLEQMALLVGLIKGPSYYNPHQHPNRAKIRRNIVLDIAAKRGLVSKEAAALAKQKPIVLHEHTLSGLNAFPSFVDLVQRRLSQTYDKKALTNDGLQIFTTLDPSIQRKASLEFAKSIASLEAQKKSRDVEGAFLLSDRNTGEILAMSGGKNPHRGDYNRALDAQRQIGSLMKPVVYLTALHQGLTLSTLVHDTAVTVTDNTTGQAWRPKNYSGRQHGPIMLYQGLAYSLNLATVRLGMQVGLEEVINNLHTLGATRDYSPLPSLLLGSEEMTPMEVLQIYQTIAAEGFYTPLRAIREVLDGQQQLLERNGIEVEQRFNQDEIWLLRFALQEVVRVGTARGLHSYLPGSLHLAGKTGTTNDNRDSWFAGFGGDKVGVVWLGRDDNTSVGLTGSSGAMVCWGKMFRAVGLAPLQDPQPDNINYRRSRVPALDPGQTGEYLAIPYKIAEESQEDEQGKGHSFSHEFNNIMNSFFDMIR